MDAWAKSLAPGQDSEWWRAATAAAAIARARALRALRGAGGKAELRTVAEGEEEGEAAADGDASADKAAADAAAEAAPLICLADQLASVCGGSQVLPAGV